MMDSNVATQNQNDVITLTNKYQQQQIESYQLSLQVIKLEDEKREFKNQIDYFKQELQDAEMLLTSASEQIQAHEDELNYYKAQDELRKKQNQPMQLQLLKNEIDELRTTIFNLNQTIQKQTLENEGLNSHINNYQMQIQTLQQLLENSKQEISELQTELQGINQFSLKKQINQQLFQTQTNPQFNVRNFQQVQLHDTQIMNEKLQLQIKQLQIDKSNQLGQIVQLQQQFEKSQMLLTLQKNEHVQNSQHLVNQNATLLAENTSFKQEIAHLNTKLEKLTLQFSSQVQINNQLRQHMALNTSHVKESEYISQIQAKDAQIYSLKDELFLNTSKVQQLTLNLESQRQQFKTLLIQNQNSTMNQKLNYLNSQNNSLNQKISLLEQSLRPSKQSECMSVEHFEQNVTKSSNNNNWRITQETSKVGTGSIVDLEGDYFSKTEGERDEKEVQNVKDIEKYFEMDDDKYLQQQMDGFGDELEAQ
ncbi:Hypothetical_protein [Hexamita inflata]|uniref:Hypothetical_protein n=1 Tax=Hexamita inflata TaxID=28002 RepID=A0AA86Q394_9EUKA|nr:Hypothetical protein HINF_LOCUS38068 [Hexamita inflata]